MRVGVLNSWWTSWTVLVHLQRQKTKLMPYQWRLLYRIKLVSCIHWLSILKVVVYVSLPSDLRNSPSWWTTRMIGLSDRERIFMIHSAVLIQSTRVTDGQTDTQTELAWHIRAIAYMLSHVKICHSSSMQNIVVERWCVKFHNDRLRNDRALVLWKSENNNPNKKHNNVGSTWGPKRARTVLCAVLGYIDYSNGTDWVKHLVIIIMRVCGTRAPGWWCTSFVHVGNKRDWKWGQPVNSYFSVSFPVILLPMVLLTLK